MKDLMEPDRVLIGNLFFEEGVTLHFNSKFNVTCTLLITVRYLFDRRRAN